MTFTAEPALIASGSVLFFLLIGLFVIIFKRPFDFICRVLTFIACVGCIGLVVIIILLGLYATGQIAIPDQIQEVAEEFVQEYFQKKAP